MATLSQMITQCEAAQGRDRWLAVQADGALLSIPRPQLSVWQKVQHFFGFGSMGYWTILNAIDRAHDHVLDEFVSNDQAFALYQTWKETNRLTAADSHSLLTIQTNARNSNRNANTLYHLVDNRFYRVNSTLNKCMWVAAIILQGICGTPRFIWEMFCGPKPRAEFRRFLSDSFNGEELALQDSYLDSRRQQAQSESGQKV